MWLLWAGRPKHLLGRRNQHQNIIVSDKTHSFPHIHVHSCLAAFHLNIRTEWQSSQKRAAEMEEGPFTSLMPHDCYRFHLFPSKLK